MRCGPRTREQCTGGSRMKLLRPWLPSGSRWIAPTRLTCARLPPRGRLAPHHPHLCGGGRAGHRNFPKQLRTPCAVCAHASVPAHALPFVALAGAPALIRTRVGWLEPVGPPLSIRCAASLVGGLAPGLRAFLEVAGPPCGGLLGCDPQGGAAKLPQYPPPHRTVHGVRAVAGIAFSTPSGGRRRGCTPIRLASGKRRAPWMLRC